MKTLEEKKLLVKMAKMFGQPIDQALIESIEKEEKLLKTLFKEEKKEEPKIIHYEKGTTFLNRKPIIEKEPEPVVISEKIEEPKVLTEVDMDRGGVSPPKPVDYITTPNKPDIIKQTMAAINTAAPKLASTLERKEIEGIKRTLAEMMQKIGTLSLGVVLVLLRFGMLTILIVQMLLTDYLFSIMNHEGSLRFLREQVVALKVLKGQLAHKEQLVHRVSREQ